MATDVSYFDSLLDWMKRQQRRYYSSDYADQELSAQWLQRPEDARYQETVVPVTVPRPLDSVLIFKPDEIGDAVCALPALAELKRELPEARFFLVASAEARPIYERTGIFTAIATAEVTTRWRRFRRLALKAALRQLGVSEFDLSIFLKTYPPLFRDFLKVPSRFRVHARDPRLPSPSLYQPRVSLWGPRRVHQALQLLELVTAVTGRRYANADIRFPELQWTESDRRALDLVFPQGVPAKFLVAHPFAKFETRRYPMEYWKALLNELGRHTGWPLVTIGGPADGELSDFPPLVQAQGKLSLGQTGFLIARSAGFVGNLSGPAHLAGALGVPTVTLMSGHSAPTEWAPGNSLILRADVPCAPCHLWSCPQYGLACLKQLTPERVLPAVLKFFGS